jgi:superfamily II DNA or RNA helicase
MSKELSLRPHQVSTLNKLREGFMKGHRAQILYAPCGAGKTEIAVSMMDGAAKKSKRSAMVIDLKLLCAQTSARLEKYDIDHGIIQPESPRYRPHLPIQVCMVQTLEARGGFPAVDLLVVDEAHTLRASVIEFVKNNPDVKVVGLSGSPFTKGLGSTYSNVVSAITVNELVNNGFLIQPRVFIAKQIDMTGAKKIAGEWSDKEATERGIKITGDVVTEWVNKTNEVFGGPKKTIVFCSGVAHGNDLVQKFSDAGFNFISISYKDDDEYKKQVLEDFSKPDTEIHGLIATDLLTKGFDVTDVCVGVSARPFSKSFSAHVQQLGRIMRPHDEKDQAIWLDHSGNYLRFRDQWDTLCAEGVSELDDGAEKIKPEPTDNEKEKAKCPKCGHLWHSSSDICAHCGFVRARKNDVIAVNGEMSELTLVAKKEKYSAEFKTDFYAQLIGYCQLKGQAPGAAYHRYIEKFGVGPSMAKPAAKEPGPEVLSWIKSRQIAYAKRRKAA